jgi:hypothetical protein
LGVIVKKRNLLTVLLLSAVLLLPETGYCEKASFVDKKTSKKYKYKYDSWFRENSILVFAKEAELTLFQNIYHSVANSTKKRVSEEEEKRKSKIIGPIQTSYFVPQIEEIFHVDKEDFKIYENSYKRFMEWFAVGITYSEKCKYLKIEKYVPDDTCELFFFNALMREYLRIKAKYGLKCANHFKREMFHKDKKFFKRDYKRVNERFCNWLFKAYKGKTKVVMHKFHPKIEWDILCLTQKGKSRKEAICTLVKDSKRSDENAEKAIQKLSDDLYKAGEKQHCEETECCVSRTLNDLEDRDKKTWKKCLELW